MILYKKTSTMPCNILLKCLIGMALYACNVAATPPLVIEENPDDDDNRSRNENRFTDPNPDMVRFRGNKYTPIKDGPKIGFKTWSGKIVIPAIYDGAGDFNKWGVAVVQIFKKEPSS